MSLADAKRKRDRADRASVAAKAKVASPLKSDDEPLLVPQTGRGLLRFFPGGGSGSSSEKYEGPPASMMLDKEAAPGTEKAPLQPVAKAAMPGMGAATSKVPAKVAAPRSKGSPTTKSSPPRNDPPGIKSAPPSNAPVKTTPTKPAAPVKATPPGKPAAAAKITPAINPTTPLNAAPPTKAALTSGPPEQPAAAARDAAMGPNRQRTEDEIALELGIAESMMEGGQGLEALLEHMQGYQLDQTNVSQVEALIHANAATAQKHQPQKQGDGELQLPETEGAQKHDSIVSNARDTGVFNTWDLVGQKFQRQHKPGSDNHAAYRARMTPQDHFSKLVALTLHIKLQAS